MKGNPEGIDLCETTTTATANDFITTIMATNAGEVSINVLAVDGLEEKNDVYVRGICGGDQMFETSVVKGTTAPTWSAPAFTFELPSDASQLELHVRDKDRFTKDDDLAVCSLSLTALVNSPGDGPYDLWVDADEEAVFRYRLFICFFFICRGENFLFLCVGAHAVQAMVGASSPPSHARIVINHLFPGPFCPKILAGDSRRRRSRRGFTSRSRSAERRE